MYFTKQYDPRPDDYGANGKLTLEAMLVMFETIGRLHSNAVSFNAETGDIVWILADWRVEISRRPEKFESLFASTWVTGKAPASSVDRNFIIRDANGEECIRAEGHFALFDLAANRLVRISEELFNSYQPEKEAAFADIPKRLRQCEYYECEHPVALRRSDIDYNRHVHNTRYIDIALEAMPDEVYERDDISGFRILYRSPVKYNDALSVRRYTDEAATRLDIFANGELCTIIEVK